MKALGLNVVASRWLGTLAIAGMLTGGCASQQERAVFPEAERARAMTPSSEAQRSLEEEASPWQRERRAQEDRFFEESRRN